MFVEIYQHNRHYAEIERWHRRHGRIATPAALLGLGVVVCSDDGEYLAAAFGYLDRITPIGAVELISTNPDNSPRTSFKAIDIAVEAITGILVSNGAKVVMSFFSHPGINRILKKNKYRFNENDITSMVYSKGDN